jgi:hypothetical protein
VVNVLGGALGVSVNWFSNVFNFIVKVGKFWFNRNLILGAALITVMSMTAEVCNIIYALLSRCVVLLGGMAVGGAPGGENPFNDVLSCLQWLNTLLPINELLSCLVVLGAWAMGWFLYRFYKSWLPTLS